MNTRMKLNRLVAITFAIVVSSVAANASWKKVAQFTAIDPNIIPTVNCSYFFDEQHGLVGLDGFNGIKRTDDGGVTWTVCTIPAGYSGLVNDIWMLDTLVGWACIEETTPAKGLWMTTDGGRSWQVDQNVMVGAASIRQRGNTIVIANRYTTPGLLVSVDGGMTFMQGGPNQYTGLMFSDSIHGVATAFATAGNTGNYASALYTSDGGVTWAPSIGMLTEAWSAYAVPGTPNFYVVGERIQADAGLGSYCHRSTDYGKSWKSISVFGGRTTGHIAGVGSVMYVQRWTALLFPQSGGLMRTTDGGMHWDSVGGPSNYRDTRFSVMGCRGQIVYAFDENGGVWKTTDGGDGRLADSNAYRFSISFRDSLRAARCIGDTVTVRFGSVSCDSLVIDDISYVNPLQPEIKSGAANLVDLPSLPSALWVGIDSFRFAWHPAVLGSKPQDATVSIRIHGSYQRSSVVVDTIVTFNVRTPADQPVGVPDTLSFGSVLKGERKCASFTLRNTGAAIDGPVMIQLLTLSPFNTSFEFSSSTRPLPCNLAPGDSITLEFCFSPTDSGSQNSEFALRDLCSRQMVFTLSGIGLDPTGIDPEPSHNGLMLNPNPAHDRLEITLRSPVANGTEVMIVDVLGRTCLRREVDPGAASETMLMDVRMLPPGVYRVILGKWSSSFLKE